MHNIGGPVLWLLPFALLSGRSGAVFFISFITILILINMYKCLLIMGMSEKTAFLVTLAYGIASPLYIYSHLSFVEPIGALVSIYLLRKLFQKQLSISDVFISSLLLSILPWVHIRFTLMEIPLFFFMLYKIYQLNKMKHFKPYAYYLIPFILLFLAFEFYNYTVWGTLNPAANQMNNNTAPLEKLPYGFNGETGHNYTIVYPQLFEHHLTDFLPSLFLPNQSWLFAVWIALFVGGAFLISRSIPARMHLQ